MKNNVWDESTNIFTDVFKESILRINEDLNADDVSRFYDEISLSLENEDLGKVFYEKLTNRQSDFFIKKIKRIGFS